MIEDRLISSGWHWSYGILRRIELDAPYGYCYEMPDGDQVFCKGHGRKHAAYFQCREDADTGEHYLCLATKVPKEAYRGFDAR
jgi:hypothetical protein